MKRQTIQQYLNLPDEWRVKENVKHEVVLMPNADDVRGAKKKDPQACALHNTACRVFNIPNAAIGGRWAYIPQRDSRGKHYIARLQATAATQRAIHRFDLYGEMPEAGFKFVPIRPSHMYKYKRAYMKDWNKGLVGGKGKPRKLRSRRKDMRSLPLNLTAS